ncbi:MAG: tRNA pseudouridine synthase A, partial [Planctomycetia bacterium]
RKAVQSHLPPAIAVHSVEEAPVDFHAIRWAVRKLYRYVYHDGPTPDVFLRRYAWRVRRRLDVALMQSAADALVGRHDFRCFETEWPNRSSSVRTIFRCRVGRLGDVVTLDVEGDGFLYNMVRTIAGTLYDIGRGKRPTAWAAEVLAGGDRRKAGATAPPEGLFLVRVDLAAPAVGGPVNPDALDEPAGDDG